MKPLNRALLGLIVASTVLGPMALAQTIPVNARVKEVDLERGTAVAAVAEASDFTAVADVAQSLGGTSLRFYAAADAICYQPWFDVDDADTAPAAASGCTLVEINITEDETADNVAAALRTELNASPYTTHFVITGATTHLIVTNVAKGTATDGNIGTSGFSVSKTQGVSAVVPIAAANVLPGLLAWKICNDPDNGSSDWLDIGETTAQTDGTRIAEGECYDCPNCTAQTLKDVRLSSEGGSNGYTVIQLK